MNLYDNVAFIFNCPYTFQDRYAGAEDYFKNNEDILPDPVRGLAMRRTNFIPDVINCELPLDNRRSPGYRRVEPNMGAMEGVERQAEAKNANTPGAGRPGVSVSVVAGAGFHLNLRLGTLPEFAR